MKKALFVLLTFAAAIFTGCEKENEDTQKENQAQNLLVGQWYYTRLEWTGEAQGQPQNGSIDYEISEREYTEFKEDGTFSDATYSGKYALSEDGKTLNLFYDTEGDETYAIKTLTSSKLVLTHTHVEETTLPAPEGSDNPETVSYLATYTETFQRK